MVVPLVLDAGSRDKHVQPLELLLPRERLDVYFGSPDRIGMKRERHVKHFHRLTPRQRALDERLAELVALTPDDRRPQTSLNTEVQQVRRSVPRSEERRV